MEGWRFPVNNNHLNTYKYRKKIIINNNTNYFTYY